MLIVGGCYLQFVVIPAIISRREPDATESKKKMTELPWLSRWVGWGFIGLGVIDIVQSIFGL